MISFSAYEIIGMGIANLRGMRRYTFPEDWTEEQRELFLDYLERISDAQEDSEECVLLLEEFRQAWGG